MGLAHKRGGKGADPRQRAGSGGVWLPGNKSLAPVVWRVQWPQEIKVALMTWENPKGTITNSDLERAAELLGWLVLEGNVPLKHEHVGLCSDNSAKVSWQMREASRRSEDETKPSVATSYTPPCLQEKPSWRHPVKILWVQERVALREGQGVSCLF